MGALLVVGTRKGLFLIRGDDERRSFEVEGPFLPGWQVNHALVDPRDGALYACANSWVYGGTVQRSTDMGKTWERSEGLGLPEESGLKLASTWHLEPGHPSQPETLWLGGEPGVLFRSDDSGASWQVNEALLGHETREQWSPGAGGLITHSITLDPDDAAKLWIGISAAGVFRSEDGGASWQPRNQGTEACFFPENRFPDVGQCVHKVLAHAGRPGRLWQQNHCGVYRSDDGGDSWERAGRERASFRLRLRARARSRGSGSRLRDPGGGGREPRHLRRQARHLYDGRRRRELAADRGRGARLGRGAP